MTESSGAPLISVLCAMHDESANVRRFVASVLRNLDAIALPYEVLVGLDGCTDDTQDRLRSALGDAVRARVVVAGVRGGKAAMLNELIRLATGRILIFTDGDVEWREGAAAALIRRFGAGPEQRLAAARPVPFPCGTGLLQRLNLLAFEVWDSVRTSHHARGELWAVSGQLYAVSRALVDRIPPHVNEDAHVGYRIRQSGAVVEYVREAVVTVSVPVTWRDFIRQKVRTRVGWLQMKHETGAPVRPLERELRRVAWQSGTDGAAPGVTLLLLALDTACRLMARVHYATSGASAFVAWRRIGRHSR